MATTITPAANIGADIRPPCIRPAAAYANWLSGWTWDVALTLNCRADIALAVMKTAVRHYWNTIDDWTCGRSARGRGIRLPRACFIHGEHGIRNWHYHCAVMLPAADAPCQPITDDQFRAELVTRWQRLAESGRYSIATPVHASAGWVRYICGEEGGHDAGFCAVTSHLPA